MSLGIAPVTDAGPLPTCMPSLMPFHISYSGPAPVSRYLRPRPAPPSLAALSTQSCSSTATLVASSSSTSILSETKSSLATISSTTSVESPVPKSECEEETLFKTGPSLEVIHEVDLKAENPAKMDSDTQPAVDTVPVDDEFRLAHEHAASRNGRRVVAAFRGRQMYGQGVDVPSGYGGLVFRAPLDSKGKSGEDTMGPSKPSSQRVKPRSKARGKTRQVKCEIVDDTMDKPNDEDADIDPLPVTRKLIPSSTFTSFLLWTPDRPMDEGRDEYARALVEWTRLAAEVGCFEHLLYILGVT